mmetsp:Transcript_45373/g.107612  ORF Transcript_45373/g.107612 Transcript_45373/m.107612 type:complete len:171 (+) Transcript_45373:3-515(+)
MADHYQVLGLQRTATAKDVKVAFLKLAQKHHPDVVSPVERVQAEKKFKQINEAYQVLGDAVKRRDYDTGGFRSAYRHASPQQPWARHDPAWQRPQRGSVPWSAYFTSKGAATFFAGTIALAVGFAMINRATETIWKTANDGKAIKRVQDDADKRASERAHRRAVARGQSW